MSRCEPGALDLDLDEDVPRDALADCLASGWTAAEIAEELGLEGVDDVARWCAYHELPAPRAAASLPPAAAPVLEVKRGARKRVSKARTTPPTVPAPTPKKGRKKPSKAEMEARRLAKNARRREREAAKVSAARALAELEAAKRDAEVIRLYGQGKGCPTISKLLGISERVALAILERHNVPRRSASKAERNAVIIAQHKQGLAPEEVAAAHKITSDVVISVVRAAGLKTHTQARREARVQIEATAVKVAVWAMRGAGADVDQIERLMRLSREQIKTILETP